MEKIDHWIEVSKKSGRTRLVCVPAHSYKRLLQDTYLPSLNMRQRALCDEGVVHGFFPGHTPITNAEMHIGFRYSLSFDLEDFFDHVRVEHVVDCMSDEEIDACFVDAGKGPRAYQGLPTSPAVSNLAVTGMDTDFSDFIGEISDRCVYTRYGDALTFSFDDPSTRDRLIETVGQIVGAHGFSLAAHKTRFLPASAGRRVICGVAVDSSGLYPTRKVRRKLRAARHQSELGKSSADRSCQGLAEWCALTRPTKPEPLSQHDILGHCVWAHAHVGRARRFF